MVGPPEEGKNERTQSSLVMEGERVWWSLQPRRWSNETAGFLCALAKARAETMPLLMLKLLDSDVEVPCWRAVQQGRSPCPSSNSDLRWGAVPSVQEVMRDDRFAGAGSVFTHFLKKKEK